MTPTLPLLVVVFRWLVHVDMYYASRVLSHHCGLMQGFFFISWNWYQLAGLPAFKLVIKYTVSAIVRKFGETCIHFYPSILAQFTFGLNTSFTVPLQQRLIDFTVCNHRLLLFNFSFSFCCPQLYIVASVLVKFTKYFRSSRFFFVFKSAFDSSLFFFIKLHSEFKKYIGIYQKRTN